MTGADRGDGADVVASPTVGLVRPTGDGGAVLLGHRCDACGTLGFPRASVCGSCGTAGVTAIELGAGGGTLFGWTIVASPPPGYTGPVPYGFGIVELEEGLRVLGRLTGVPPQADVGATEALAFGQRMRCVVDDVRREGAEPLRVWAFAPAEGGGGR